MLIDALAHFFVPQYSNNHKAKALHNSSLIAVLLLVIVYQFVIAAIPFTGTKVLGYAANISVGDVVALTNAKRVESGVGELQINPLLNEAARQKGEDMLAKDYWAHVAPDGTEPWKFFSDVGYVYRYAGENLARDFSNAQSAVDAWMASPSHKENLLSTKYQEVGIAVVEGDLNGVDTTLIVQLFGTRSLADQVKVPEFNEGVEVATVASLGVDDISPTPTLAISPTIVPEEIQEVTVVSEIQASDGIVGSAQVSPFSLTQGFSLAVLGILLAVIVVDAVVVIRKRVPRVSGRSLAHFAFLGMVFIIVVIAQAGDIL